MNLHEPSTVWIIMLKKIDTIHLCRPSCLDPVIQADGSIRHQSIKPGIIQALGRGELGHVRVGHHEAARLLDLWLPTTKQPVCRTGHEHGKFAKSMQSGANVQKSIAGPLKPYNRKAATAPGILVKSSRLFTALPRRFTALSHVLGTVYGFGGHCSGLH